MATFRESRFSIVVKFFNIDSCFWFLIDLNVQTNHIKEFYNGVKLLSLLNAANV